MGLSDKVDIEETEHEMTITIDKHGVGRQIAEGVIAHLRLLTTEGLEVEDPD